MSTPVEHACCGPEAPLAERLPENESILWQGRPDARSLMVGTFHVRKLVVYFVALMAMGIALQVADGVAFAGTLSRVSLLAVLAAVALGILTGYAALVARTSEYTITDKRVLIRCGVALPLTVNLPLSHIEAAQLRERSDGSGEIALLPIKRVSYVLLWPMVKPWRFIRVRPVLRGIPDVAAAADKLAGALAITPASAETRAVRKHDKPVERAGLFASLGRQSVPVAAAFSLVIFTVVAVAFIRITGNGPAADAGPVEPAVAAMELFFADREDGAIVITNAADGQPIDVLEPGSGGFVRVVMRSFARARRAMGEGPEVPFSLRRTESGRLLLADSVTGREFDLRAFGATNREAFGRLLDLRQQHAGDDAGHAPLAEASVSAVASIKQESRE